MVAGSSTREPPTRRGSAAAAIHFPLDRFPVPRPTLAWRVSRLRTCSSEQTAPTCRATKGTDKHLATPDHQPGVLGADFTEICLPPRLLFRSASVPPNMRKRPQPREVLPFDIPVLSSLLARIDWPTRPVRTLSVEVPVAPRTGQTTKWERIDSGVTHGRG